MRQTIFEEFGRKKSRELEGCVFAFKHFFLFLNPKASSSAEGAPAGRLDRAAWLARTLPLLRAASLPSPKLRSTRCIIDSVSRVPRPPCHFCLHLGRHKPWFPSTPHPCQTNSPGEKALQGARGRDAHSLAQCRPWPTPLARTPQPGLLWQNQCMHCTAQGIESVRTGWCVRSS